MTEFEMCLLSRLDRLIEILELPPTEEKVIVPENTGNNAMGKLPWRLRQAQLEKMSRVPKAVQTEGEVNASEV